MCRSTNQHNATWRLSYFLLVVLSTMILLPASLMAQGTGRIVGRVVESGTDSPLPGANIVVVGTTKGAATDVNGRFIVTNVATGTYSVTASYLGFTDVTSEAQVVAGESVEISFELQQTVLAGQTVEIMGKLTLGQAKSFHEQKNAPNIKNVVSSDLFQLFPDRNAAETVARIPSVSIAYDQGEGEFVQIRGIGPEYNSLTINGQRIPAPDPDAGRSVGLDLLNQDLIQNIVVTKALTPDIDGDAIGGNIDFEMMQAREEGMLAVNVGGGYNVQQSDFNDYGNDIIDVSAYGGRRFLDNKLGVLVAGSYYKTNRGSTLREFEYDDLDDGLTEGNIFAQHSNDYDVKRQRMGVNMNTEYRFNDFNRVFLNLNHNIYLDDEIRRLVEFVVSDDGEPENAEEKTTRNRLEDQTLSTVMFGGEHNVRGLKVDYQASWIKAQESMPDRTYFRFERDNNLELFTNDQIKDFDGTTKFTGQDPLELNRIRVDDKLTEDSDVAGLVNVELPFTLMNKSTTLKFGGKYLAKSVKFEEVRLELKKFAEDHTIGEGEFGFIDKRLTVDDVAYLDPSTSRYLDMSDDNYEASESVLAAYGMATVSVSEKLSILAGLRFENTTNKYQTLSEISENKKESDASYSSILPSIHATYRFNDDINFRAAYSTGIARPNYKSLVPVENRDDDDLEISRGNPDLEPTRANNFDLMFEKYSAHLGLFSAGVFYKNLTDIIVVSEFEETIGGEIYDVRKPINGTDDATVFGVEFAVNQRLNILNVAALNHFSIYANYTYTNSKSTVGGRELPLPSSPQNIFNLALMYDNPENGLSFVISNNFRSAILGSVGKDKYYDAYYDSEYHLDVSATKKITDKFSLTLQLNNLTDQAEHEVFADPSESYSIIRQWAKFNRYGTVSLSYRL